MVAAQDAAPLATPVTTEGDQPVASPDAPADPEETKPAPMSSDISPMAISGSFFIPRPTFDTATNTLLVEITLNNGFSAAAGDEISFYWDDSNLTLFPGDAPIALTGIPGATVEIDDVDIYITIVFGQAVSVIGDPLEGSALVSGDVSFEQCGPNSEPYTQETWLWFFTPSVGWQPQEINGDECPATTVPAVSYVDYDEWDAEMYIEVFLPGPPVAGQQMTVSYDPTRLSVPPGPFDLIGYAADLDRNLTIGTATASNGLITITLRDAPVESDWREWSELSFPATLLNEDCDPAGGAYFTELDPLLFVTNDGLEFEEDLEGMVCNAEGPSKTGEWSEDAEGNPIIIWTIDTGDILLQGSVYDYDGGDGFLFDCSDSGLVIEPVYGEFEQWGSYCDQYGFSFSLSSTNDEPFRAIITATASLDPEYTPTSFVNCASVEVNIYNDEQARAAASNGLGGQACAELFPPDGGDFITKTVDKAEAKSGETVAYTVTVSTTSDRWSTIDVSDQLPAGFTIDPASITCAVVPAVHQSDPCYMLSGNELIVIAVPERVEEEEGWWYDQSAPVTITLTFSGTVAGEPGTNIVNEVCSIRQIEVRRPVRAALSMGDPTIPGGGRICAVANTLIIGDPVATPTTPPSPGTTPTVPPVTDLPETGNGTGPTGVGILLTTLAASILAVGALGSHLRAPHRR